MRFGRPRRPVGVVVALVAATLVGCAAGPTGTPSPAAAPTPAPTPAPVSPVSDAASPQPTAQAATVGRVVGRVLKKDGTPAAHCAIDKGGGTEEAVATDARGRFSFSQMPGEYVMRFACSASPDGDATKVTVTAGRVTELTVRLAATR